MDNLTDSGTKSPRKFMVYLLTLKGNTISVDFIICNAVCIHERMINPKFMVWFYGISTTIGYLMPNPFLYLLTVLFQTIQLSISKHFKCQKYFYFKLFSLVNKVKWFQVLLSITNNSIKHQSFICTELDVKAVPFQTIQCSISTLFSSI